MMNVHDAHDHGDASPASCDAIVLPLHHSGEVTAVLVCMRSLDRQAHGASPTHCSLQVTVALLALGDIWSRKLPHHRSGCACIQSAPTSATPLSHSDTCTGCPRARRAHACSLLQFHLQRRDDSKRHPFYKLNSRAKYAKQRKAVVSSARCTPSHRRVGQESHLQSIAARPKTS